MKIIHLGINPNLREQEKGDDLNVCISSSSDRKSTQFEVIWLIYAGIDRHQRKLLTRQFLCLNNIEHVRTSYSYWQLMMDKNTIVFKIEGS